MDIKDFKSGCFKQGYKYQYFLPEKINHDFSWQDPSINALLEDASLHLGELNSFSSLVPDSKSTTPTQASGYVVLIRWLQSALIPFITTQASGY